jgi:hypothetical protein
MIKTLWSNLGRNLEIFPLLNNNCFLALKKIIPPSPGFLLQGSSQHTSPVLNKPNQLELGASDQQARSNAGNLLAASFGLELSMCFSKLFSSIVPKC